MDEVINSYVERKKRGVKRYIIESYLQSAMIDFLPPQLNDKIERKINSLAGLFFYW